MCAGRASAPAFLREGPILAAKHWQCLPRSPLTTACWTDLCYVPPRFVIGLPLPMRRLGTEAATCTGPTGLPVCFDHFVRSPKSVCIAFKTVVQPLITRVNLVTEPRVQPSRCARGARRLRENDTGNLSTENSARDLDPDRSAPNASSRRALRGSWRLCLQQRTRCFQNADDSGGSNGQEESFEVILVADV